MEGTREVRNSVVLILTTSSKNIARFTTATKFLKPTTRIVVNVMAAVRLGTFLFSTSECEVTLPNLFEFLQM